MQQLQSMDITHLGVLMMVFASFSTIIYTARSVLQKILTAITNPIKIAGMRTLTLQSADPLYIEFQQFVEANRKHLFLWRSYKFTSRLDSFEHFDFECRTEIGFGYGTCFLKVPGFPLMKIHRESVESKTFKSKDKLQITIYSFDAQCVERVHNKLVELQNHIDENKNPKLYQTLYGSFHDLGQLPDTDEPVGENALQFIRDVEQFIVDAPIYKQRKLVHKQAILLHGEPGTGKTSVVRYLAQLLNRNLYYITSTGYAELNEVVRNVEPNSILLLDDLDRTDMIANQSPAPSGGPAILINGENSTRKDSTKEIMDIVDGVSSLPILIIATTNHIDKLDPALLRKGRFGRQYQIDKLASAEQAIYFKRFYEGDEQAQINDYAALIETHSPMRTMAELHDVLKDNFKSAESAFDQLIAQQIQIKPAA